MSDWANAAQMIRAAGYIHPAGVIEEQAGEIARLKAVLQFYADRASYNAVGGYARPVDRDHGRRAREALGEGLA